MRRTNREDSFGLMKRFLEAPKATRWVLCLRIYISDAQEHLALILATVDGDGLSAVKEE